MKKVLSAGVLLAGIAMATQVTAAPPTPIAAAGAGSGEILSETSHGVTIHFELFPEVQSMTGSFSGTIAYESPEKAVVNFVTLQGTFHVVSVFSGTIAGVPCNATITQNGQIDFSGPNPTWEANWRIVGSDCGVHGQGTLLGEGVFTSATTYDVTTSWTGQVH